MSLYFDGMAIDCRSIDAVFCDRCRRDRHRGTIDAYVRAQPLLPTSSPIHADVIGPVPPPRVPSFVRVSALMSACRGRSPSPLPLDTSPPPPAQRSCELTSMSFHRTSGPHPVSQVPSCRTLSSVESMANPVQSDSSRFSYPSYSRPLKRVRAEPESLPDLPRKRSGLETVSSVESAIPIINPFGQQEPFGPEKLERLFQTVSGKQQIPDDSSFGPGSGTLRALEDNMSPPHTRSFPSSEFSPSGEMLELLHRVVDGPGKPSAELDPSILGPDKEYASSKSVTSRRLDVSTRHMDVRKGESKLSRPHQSRSDVKEDRNLRPSPMMPKARLACVVILQRH